MTRDQKITLAVILTGLAVLIGLAIGLVSGKADAHSGSPAMTTFSGGQTITHTQLNDAFSHLHNTLTNGLSNTNLATNAAIAHSKLATPFLVPKAIASVGAGCTTAAGSLCSLLAGTGIAAVKSRGTAGAYWVHMTTAPPNGAFIPLVSCNGLQGCRCSANTFTAGTSGSSGSPQFAVDCMNTAGTLAMEGFSLVLFHQ